MNGVEILSVEQVAVAFRFSWTAFWIVTAAIWLMFLVVGIAIGLDNGSWFHLIGVVPTGIILSFILGTLAGIWFAEATEYTNQYTVTISDEVSMNEFMEKYAFIEQDGKIYTVRERVEG